MGALSRGICPHGRTPSSCLVCQALDAAEPSGGRRGAPERGPGPALGWTAAKLGIVAVVAVLVVSWAAAFLWAAVRILELVAVAFVAGWVGWRLGVRHGRRHPR